jgi:hypothetical protein
MTRGRRSLWLILGTIVALSWLGVCEAQAQAGRRPKMPVKPPILPATNGRPPAFQQGHGLFGNIQGAIGGQTGQTGQFGQQGGGFGGIGGGGIGGGFGAVGGIGGGLGGIGGGVGGIGGGIGGGGTKGFGLGGGLMGPEPGYSKGFGLYGGRNSLDGLEASVDSQVRTRAEKPYLIGPTATDALR